MLRALLGGGIRGWRRARFVQEASKEMMAEIDEQLSSRQRDKAIEAARQGRRATGGAGIAAANAILIGLNQRTENAIQPLTEAIENAYAPEKLGIEYRLKELRQTQRDMQAPLEEEREKLTEDERRTWREAEVRLRQRPEYKEILQRVVTRLKDHLQEESRK